VYPPSGHVDGIELAGALEQMCHGIPKRRPLFKFGKSIGRNARRLNDESRHCYEEQQPQKDLVIADVTTAIILARRPIDTRVVEIKRLLRPANHHHHQPDDEQHPEHVHKQAKDDVKGTLEQVHAEKAQKVMVKRNDTRTDKEHDKTPKNHPVCQTHIGIVFPQCGMGHHDAQNLQKALR